MGKDNSALFRVIDKILEWLKKAAPTALAISVYRYLKAKIWRLEVSKDELELDLALKENEALVEKDNSDKTDLDIVNDAISEGEKLD